MEIPVENTVLTKEDILTTVKYLVELNNGKGKVDDIDHLAQRRICSSRIHRFAHRAGLLAAVRRRPGIVAMRKRCACACECGESVKCSHVSLPPLSVRP